MAIQSIGTSSPQLCGDTIEQSTLSTSAGTTKKRGSKGIATKSKPQESDTSDFKESTDDLPPYFLSDELHGLTFQSGGEVFHADDISDVGVAAWEGFVKQYANVKGEANWKSLGERVRFANELFAFCKQKNIPFPFTVDPSLPINQYEKFNVLSTNQ